MISGRMVFGNCVQPLRACRFLGEDADDTLKYTDLGLCDCILTCEPALNGRWDVLTPTLR